MSKYVNIPLSCLPETLTMPRLKKDICDKTLYKIGVDKAVGHDDTVIMACLKSAVDQNVADIFECMNSITKPPATTELEGISRGIYLDRMMCYGTCQPQRPARKHINSTIVEPKQLT